MSRALVFLLARSVRGRVVRSLRLLKRPKYIVGLLGFVAWMAFATAGVWLDSDDDVHIQYGAGELLAQLSEETLAIGQIGVALVLAMLLSLWWLVPWSRIALDLKEAEIHLLMPTPVRRRHLIQYAILKSQPGILFGCLMLTIFVGAGGLRQRALWFVCTWMLLTVWDLHSKGRALWNAAQAEVPRPRALARRALLVAVVVIFWITVGQEITRLVAELPALGPAGDLGEYSDVRQYLVGLVEHYGPRIQESRLAWMLAPLVWLLRPYFTVLQGTPLDTLAALAVPVVLLVVHNEWVVRSRTRFEEAALAHARRQARKTHGAARYWKTSLRSRRRRPFDLVPVGPPEVAVFWKNLMMVRRMSIRTTVLLVLAAIVATGVLPPLLGAPGWITATVALWALLSMLVFPVAAGSFFRNDLRSDLPKFEVLRPWPLPGWKLVAYQIAGPAFLAGLGALGGACLILAADLGWMLAAGTGPSEPPAFVAFVSELSTRLAAPRFLLVPLAVLAILPPVLAASALSSALQNLAVLIFPGWVQLGTRRQEGPATFGQNIVVFFGLSLAMLLATLPSVLILGLWFLIQVWVFDLGLVAWELPLMGIVAATPIAAAAGLVVRVGGGLWDRLDPSREILEQGG